MRLLTAVSGVRVPQQAPKQTTQNEWFFCCYNTYLGHPHLRCMALPLTLLSAVDAHEFAISRWPSPQPAPDKHSEMSAFLFLFYGQDPCGVATLLCIRHCFLQWTLAGSLFHGGRVRKQLSGQAIQVFGILGNKQKQTVKKQV